MSLYVAPTRDGTEPSRLVESRSREYCKGHGPPSVNRDTGHKGAYARCQKWWSGGRRAELAKTCSASQNYVGCFINELKLEAESPGELVHLVLVLVVLVILGSSTLVLLVLGHEVTQARGILVADAEHLLVELLGGRAAAKERRAGDVPSSACRTD